MLRVFISITKYIAFFFIFLICLTLFVRFVIHQNKPDLVEKAVSLALGNKHLVLGSRLELWFEELGKPDISVKFDGYHKYTEFYWLDSGIAVRVDGDLVGKLDFALKKDVVVIYVPLTKKIPSEFMINRKIIFPDSRENSEIEFQKLLYLNTGELEIKYMPESEMNKLYDYYDPSNDIYYNMAQPFNKVSAKVWGANPECGGPDCKQNKIQIIGIANTNFLDWSNFIAFNKRFFSGLFLK